MLKLIGIVLMPFTWGFGQMATMLQQSGALAIYIVMFAIGLVMRLVVKPFIGEAHKDVSKATRQNARDFLDKYN